MSAYSKVNVRIRGDRAAVEAAMRTMDGPNGAFDFGAVLPLREGMTREERAELWGTPCYAGEYEDTTVVEDGGQTVATYDFATNGGAPWEVCRALSSAHPEVEVLMRYCQHLTVDYRACGSFSYRAGVETMQDLHEYAFGHDDTEFEWNSRDGYTKNCRGLMAPMDEHDPPAEILADLPDNPDDPNDDPGPFSDAHIVGGLGEEQ